MNCPKCKQEMLRMATNKRERLTYMFYCGGCKKYWVISEVDA